MKVKRLIALLLCVAALCSLVTGVSAADMITVGCQTPEDWNGCYVYWWGSTGYNPSWPGEQMAKNAEGTWEYDVPTDAVNLIFNNGEGTQSKSLPVPDVYPNKYIFETETWQGFQPELLYIVAGSGALCGTDWNPSDRANRMTDDDGDGIFTKTYENVAAGRYELKVSNGSWNKSWGDPETGANYVLNVPENGADVTVGFDTANEVIIISFDGITPVIKSSISGTVDAFSGSGSAVVTFNNRRTTLRQLPGTYSYTDLSQGEYTLTVTREGCVTFTDTITIDAEPVTCDVTLTVMGDINIDGKINVGDVAKLYSHVRQQITLSDYALACADLTADGKINMGDVAKLYADIRKPQKPEEPVDPPVQPPVEPVEGVYVLGQDELPYTDEQIYQQLFDPESKLEIDLDMSDKELQKLQEDYERYHNMGSKSPIYRLGKLTITITTDAGTVSYVIPEVGARMKGNTSRTSFYNEEKGIYKYIHFKFDFQETFDDEEYYGSDCKVWASDEERDARKDRTFATLEKLEMRWNKLYDRTYLKEAYAYEVFRSEGVLAPQCNIGALTWSGALMGIYTVEEPVDKIFIERNVPEEDAGGDLYKLGWTNDGATFTSTDSIGVEDEDKGQFFIYDLKTNKKKSTHETLKNLINHLNSGSVTKDSYAQVVDVDNFLSFAAVSYFMGNGDDLRNNYNNCYMYFLKSSGKAIFIPYDFDRCLGINREFNPSGHSMTRDNPFGEGNQRSPLFRYSVDKGGFYTAEYTDVLLRVADNPLLDPDSFAQRFYIAEELYQDLVTPERKLENADGRNFAFDLNHSGSANSGDNMSFADYINAKMSAFRNYLGLGGNSGSVQGQWYVCGSFNNWSVEDRYALKTDGDTATVTLSVYDSFKFKVYNNMDGTWLGTECLTADTNVLWETDQRGNIILNGGAYHITFNPTTRQITVTNA